MDTMMQLADAIKQGVNQIIDRNLFRDEQFKHESNAAREHRWNVAKNNIGKVVDYNLIADPDAALALHDPGSREAAEAARE